MARLRQFDADFRYDAEPLARPVSVEEAARWRLPIVPSDLVLEPERQHDQITRRLSVALALLIVVYFGGHFIKAVF